ncbi:MAG: hypothetical protein CSB48_12295 [Proteobacteria bacterium]|nr:MAG: hypothetical protein CSB48_12295 [Pseudomonadota bacterium]
MLVHSRAFTLVIRCLVEYSAPGRWQAVTQSAGCTIYRTRANNTLTGIAKWKTAPGKNHTFFAIAQETAKQGTGYRLNQAAARSNDGLNDLLD